MEEGLEGNVTLAAGTAEETARMGHWKYVRNSEYVSAPQKATNCRRDLHSSHWRAGGTGWSHTAAENDPKTVLPIGTCDGNKNHEFMTKTQF